MSRAVNLRTEPAAIVGTVTALVSAGIVLAVAFGADISTDQREAVIGFVAVAAPLVAAFLTRRRVYSPATVDRIRARHRAV